jgi:hypothetical protein
MCRHQRVISHLGVAVNPVIQKGLHAVPRSPLSRFQHAIGSGRKIPKRVVWQGQENSPDGVARALIGPSTGGFGNFSQAFE